MLNNKNSRTKNAMYSSISAGISNLCNVLMAFVYRTIFLHILSIEYLGISGLFSNILQMISLVDFGIGTALNYRLYEPIGRGDVRHVGELMNLYRIVYNVIIVVILSIGIIVIPVLPFLINGNTQIPQDVNLYVIYVLYLIQTASSYMFSYKQTLLSADQRQHIISLIQSFVKFVTYLLQSAVLYVYRDFTVTLFVGISMNIVINYLISIYISKEYSDVFAVQGIITKEERTIVIKETKACLCHKVGGVILNSTDNIVLAKFTNLSIVGIYSNYTMILNNLTTIITQVLTNFVSSVGNAHFELDTDKQYDIYKKLNFANFWIGSITSISLYSLVNPFIKLWVGKALLLNEVTVICICLQFYLEIIRKINMMYTNACGLFVKDVRRPIVEAAVNIVVSIVLVVKIGVSGVFLGTIISHLLTVFWREPLILYKYEFRRKTKDYWKEFFFFTAFTCVFCASSKMLCDKYVNGVVNWFLAGFLVVLVANLLLIVILHNREEFFYFRMLVIQLLSKIKSVFINRSNVL